MRRPPTSQHGDTWEMTGEREREANESIFLLKGELWRSSILRKNFHTRTLTMRYVYNPHTHTHTHTLSLSLSLSFCVYMCDFHKREGLFFFAAFFFLCFRCLTIVCVIVCVCVV
jgi:hypothetical protein